MKRESTEDLTARMLHAEGIIPKGIFIRHVRTGGEYFVRGHCLRVGDLMPMMNYSPSADPVVVFSRAVPDVLAKFVRLDGLQWPLSTPHDQEGGT